MTLSSELVGALKSFNEMDPATRTGMLPITDGARFLNRVVSSPPDQAPAPAGRSSPEKAAGGAGDFIENAKLDPYVFSPPGMDIS